jgi:FlaA1/EpsC-like NDP-sugar epimerase
LIRSFFNRLTVLPRGVVILIDQLLIVFSVGLAFLLRFNFNVEEIRHFNPFLGTVLCIASALLATLITKSYAGIVRYTGIQDGLRIVGTELLSLLLIVIFNLVYYYNFKKNVIPYSVVFISFFISSLLLY